MRERAVASTVVAAASQAPAQPYRQGGASLAAEITVDATERFAPPPAEHLCDIYHLFFVYLSIYLFVS